MKKVLVLEDNPTMLSHLCDITGETDTKNEVYSFDKNECLDFPGNNAAEKTLYFRKEGIILAVDREDIVYVEIISHVLHIHTRNKDTMTIPYITIRKFLDEADSCDFIQCSRNAVINKKYIKEWFT